MDEKKLEKIHKYRSRAVWAGFTTNVIIAIVKWISFLKSDSSAVFSEALHSTADSINSALLFVGIWSSSKPPDDEHPYGYGKDAYFWALIASIFMLGVTSTFSITQGYERVISGDEMKNFNLAIFGLVLSFGIEIIAVYVIMHGLIATINIQKNIKVRFRDLFKVFKETDSPAIKLVFIEDFMAMSGALIALVAVGIVQITNIHAIDGIAAMIIGILLGGLAIMLAAENHDKLIGASAPDELEHKVYKTTMNYPPIRDVADLKTMVMGPNQVIAHLRIELDPETPVEEMDDITSELEKRIIKDAPQITDCFIEVIADEDATEPLNGL